MDARFRRAERAPLKERPRCRNVASLQLTLPLAILTIALVATGRASGADKAAASKHGPEAKFEYCQECHGLLGQGYHGYYPIPRLAGQQTEYFENQLRAFIEHRRANNIMYHVARVLNPAMITALAKDFRALNPKPLADAPRKLVGTGEEIFQNGVPDDNVAACAACHGPEAMGMEQIPRLAGQLYPYVVKALSNWSQERGQDPASPDTSAVMKPVAHSLTKRQIEAVAAYVSYLK